MDEAEVDEEKKDTTTATTLSRRMRPVVTTRRSKEPRQIDPVPIDVGVAPCRPATHGKVSWMVVLELVLSFITRRSSVMLSFGGWLRWRRTGDCSWESDKPTS
jgi:hypothetical protein